MKLLSFTVDDIIKRALAEDINYMDVSTVYLFDEDARSDAYFVAKADGVLCGIEIALRVFELLDPTVKATALPISTAKRPIFYRGSGRR